MWTPGNSSGRHPSLDTEEGYGYSLFDGRDIFGIPQVFDTPITRRRALPGKNIDMGPISDPAQTDPGMSNNLHKRQAPKAQITKAHADDAMWTAIFVVAVAGALFWRTQ